MKHTEYSVEEEISNFFSETSATQPGCDARAQQLVGGKPTPVDVQGSCSYSVYAGPSLEFVVQFRLKTLQLDMEIASLARQSNDKEPLYVYVMGRMEGVTHLDFILSHDSLENSAESSARRQRLLADVARFFALAWKAPLSVDETHRVKLKETIETDLRMLLGALPARLHSIIQNCLNSMEAIMSLPMVLFHRDFGSSNIMVDSKTCHLVGVIDWAEADIYPFGMNFHSMQAITGKLHLRDGWTRYDDYDHSKDIFWTTFKDEVGGLSDDSVDAIRLAMIVGLLLSKGFTSRLANQPKRVPIGDDENGRYNMLSLDGFLVNPETRFECIN